MDEKILALYEQQILMMLAPLKVSKNKDGLQYIKLNRNAFAEIKGFYIHFNPSYDENYLDEAIKRLLPELRIAIDRELIEELNCGI